MVLLSPLPVAIPLDRFPEEFLAACCYGEGPALGIDASEAKALGIESSSQLGFALNFRGRGHWSVSVWRRTGGKEPPCYLTEEAVRLLKRNGERSWILSGP